MAIGNGLTDPRSQTLVFPDTAYDFGLVDSVGRQHIRSLTDDIVANIDDKRWDKAQKQRSELIE